MPASGMRTVAQGAEASEIPATQQRGGRSSSGPLIFKTPDANASNNQTRVVLQILYSDVQIL